MNRPPDSIGGQAVRLTATERELAALAARVERTEEASRRRAEHAAEARAALAERVAVLENRADDVRDDLNGMGNRLQRLAQLALGGSGLGLTVLGLYLSSKGVG